MTVHALQDGGNEQEFECTAHGKPLVPTVVRALAGGSVEHGNAEPATIGPLKLCESGCQIAETPRSRMENARKREAGSYEKRSTAKHSAGRSVERSWQVRLSGMFEHCIDLCGCNPTSVVSMLGRD